LTLVSALCLVALGFIAHFPALRAGFVWDDFLVYDNVYIRTIPGVINIWTHLAVQPESDVRYWPLFYSSFWFDYHLSGTKPIAYHVINLLIHLANVLLLWQLLRRLKIPGAWLASALFAAHPVHVESVAWVIERKGLLSMLFYLLAFETNRRFYETKRHQTHVLACVLLACSLLSKPVAVSFPLVVIAWLYWKGEALTTKTLKPTIPYFAICAFSGLINIWAVKLYDPVSNGFGLGTRLVLAGKSFWFYVWKLLWPLELMAIFPRWNVADGSLWQYVFPFAALALLFAFWLFRARLGRGPYVAMLVFGFILAPVLGFQDFSYMTYSFVASRYQYLASAVMFALAAAAVVRWADERSLLATPVFRSSVALVLLCLGVLAWRQAQTFESIETLFQHNIEVNPSAPAAHDSLGFALLEKGRYAQAEEHFREAIGLDPRMHEAHNNLGLLKVYQDKVEEAIPHYQKALEIKPDFGAARSNLGNAYARLGRTQEAVDTYEKLAEIDPGNADACYGLGVISLQAGEPLVALERFQKCIELDPRFANAHNNLGVTYEKLGNMTKAMEHYAEALRIDPKNVDACFNLGNAYFRQDRFEDAAKYCRKVVELSPSHAVAHNLLGDSLLNVGDIQGALSHYAQSVRIDPTLTDTAGRKAWIRATSGEPQIRNAAEAVRFAELANGNTGGQDPRILNTLAAAYACAERYKEAADCASKALQICREKGLTEMVPNLERSIQLYQQGQAMVVR